MKLSRVLLLCLAISLAVAALAALALGSQAATTMRVWGDPHVSVVVDTGDGLAAHNTDPEHLGSTRTLLATGSAPFGDRRALAATLHRLQNSDTRLFQMVSGWCAFAPLQPAEFLFLSQATGGPDHYTGLARGRGDDGRQHATVYAVL